MGSDLACICKEFIPTGQVVRLAFAFHLERSPLDTPVGQYELLLNSNIKSWKYKSYKLIL